LAEAALNSQERRIAEAITKIENELVMVSGSRPLWKVSPVSIRPHGIHSSDGSPTFRPSHSGPSDSADATLTRTPQPPTTTTSVAGCNVRLRHSLGRVFPRVEHFI
jgi:hypothetical protein